MPNKENTTRSLHLLTHLWLPAKCALLYLPVRVLQEPGAPWGHPGRPGLSHPTPRDPGSPSPGHLLGDGDSQGQAGTLARGPGSQSTRSMARQRRARRPQGNETGSWAVGRVEEALGPKCGWCPEVLTPHCALGKRFLHLRLMPGERLCYPASYGRNSFQKQNGNFSI